jgi:hypothetical protein
VQKTRNQIIEELYLSKDIASALRKMQPASLRDDLRQEMFISLCNLPEEKFWNLHENNALKFYLVRAMLNMIRSTGMNQPFFKNFRAKFESIEEIDNIADQIDDRKDEKEKLFDLLDERRKDLCWYENTLLDQYVASNFNQMELHRKTRIPYPSIVKTISLIKNKLKDE